MLTPARKEIIHAKRLRREYIEKEYKKNRMEIR
jgi:hypothetical protein